MQLSDQQLKQITDAVTGAVLNKLKAPQQEAGQATPKPAVAPDEAGLPAELEQGFTSSMQEQEFLFVANLETALKAVPALFSEMGSILARTDGRPEGPGPLAFLAMVGAVFAAALALGYAGATVAGRSFPGVPPAGGAASVSETLRRAACTLAGFAVFWLVTAIASHKLFAGHDMQSMTGHWLLAGGVQFGLMYTVFLIFFRPGDAAYRIVPLETRDARLAMRLFVTVLAVAVLRSWILLALNDDLPKPVIAAGLLLNIVIFAATFFAAALPAQEAVRRWIENTRTGERLSAPRQWLARNWLRMTGSAVVLLTAVHAYGAVFGHTGVVAGLTGTVRMVMIMVLLCSFSAFVGRRSDRTDQLAKRAIPKLPGLVSQMLRVFILLGAGVYLIKLWFVDALGVMSPGAWTELADYAFEPLAAAFFGYLAISSINFLAARYTATQNAAAAAATESEDSAATAANTSSRLRTLIPVLRITAIVIIVIMTGLIALSHLGFNITPLLAGASVVGLAISFGSQALVKDIVSGVLFLAEDFFRVGEYIECGKSIGTVEGFTLRSVRLRHQNGQIFTVPFGQLGEITNFSRDWTMVKFNMSLDRDVDLDAVRRVTKTVAAEVKAEYKDRVLEPLKVQGVKDVTDLAVIVQFKFTSLPGSSGEIERMARSHLLKVFKEEGIALSRHPWFTPGASATA